MAFHLFFNSVYYCSCRGPVWSWNPNLLGRCVHLVQENCSLLCACFLFTLFPFPAICSASLCWKSGRVGATCASCPAANALQTTSCFWNRVGTLFSREAAAVTKVPMHGHSAQPLQNILEYCHLDSTVSPHCIWSNQKWRADVFPTGIYRKGNLLLCIKEQYDSSEWI